MAEEGLYHDRSDGRTDRCCIEWHCGLCDRFCTWCEQLLQRIEEQVYEWMLIVSAGRYQAQLIRH